MSDNKVSESVSEDEAIQSNTDEAMFLEQDMAVADAREAELDEIAATLGGDETVVNGTLNEVIIPSEDEIAEATAELDAMVNKGEDDDEAPAGSEDEAEDEAENTPSEEPEVDTCPQVTLTFGDDTVDIMADENFHLNLRAACQEAGQRADEVAVSGFLDITQEKSLAGATKQ